MALPTTRMLGSRYVLLAGATPTVVGGGMNATLEITRDMIDIFAKVSGANTGWRDFEPTIVRWNFGGEVNYLKTGAEVKACTASLTIGATGLLEATNFTLNVDVELAEAVTTDSSCGRALTPVARNVTLDFDALFVDPLNAASPNADALEAIIADVNGGTSALAAVLTFGSNQTYTFNCRGSSFSMGTPVADHATVSGTLQAVGTVTQSVTGGDAGLLAIIDDIMIADITAMAGFAVHLENTQDGIGSTKWNGQCYASNLQVQVPIDGIVKMTIQAEGDGTLTQSAVV